MAYSEKFVIGVVGCNSVLKGEYYMAADFDKLWNDDREDLNTLKEFCRYWYECGQKSKVAQNSTDNQQLQAKIADRMKQLHEYYQPSEQFSRDAVITMLRQLSAVQ